MCVQSTLNDTQLLDVVEFMKMYSRICYPLFVWNIMLYRAHDLTTMPMLKFCEIVRLSSFSIGRPEISLKQLNQRVQHNVSMLNRRRPDLAGKLSALKKELVALGVTEEDTYLYIQGHHIMNAVVLRILSPLCRSLRHAREEEIQRLAYHRVQYTNEIAAYRNSQCDVLLALRKNINYKNMALYERLREDVRSLLDEIKSEKKQ